MWAAVLTEQPREIRLQEMERPIPGEKEVLIQVDYCGICGSDLHAYNHAKGYEFVPRPVVPGHEISGKVVDVHHSLSAAWIGQNVVVESMHYCGNCLHCSRGRTNVCLNQRVIGLHFNGGMAQFVKVHAQYLRPVPENLSNKVAALCEPMAIAVHAVDRTPEVTRGRNVLVQGPGSIGLFVAIACKEKGAEVVLSGLAGIDDRRLEIARLFGLTPHYAGKESLPERFDVVFECAGSLSAIEHAFQHLQKGGACVHVALYEQPATLFLTDVVRNEWTIRTAYGCQTEDYTHSFRLLEKYRPQLESVVSVFPLKDAPKAFETGLNKNVLKPILAISSA